MKRLCLLLLTFTLNFTLSAQLSGDTYASAQEKGTATWVLAYVDTPGFMFKGADGKMAGVCKELIEDFKKYVETEKGIKVTMDYKRVSNNDFSKFLEDIKTAKGGVFGLANVTITDERKASYSFSPPFIQNIPILVTNSSVATLSDLSKISEQFKGMTAYTVKNTTNEKNLLEVKNKYFPDLKIAYLPSNTEVLDKVASDKNAFSNLDFTFYLAAKQQNKPVKYHPADEAGGENFGVIMPKSNDWAGLMNQFFATGYISSVEYRKAVAANLGNSALKMLDTIK